MITVKKEIMGLDGKRRFKGVGKVDIFRSLVEAVLFKDLLKSGRSIRKSWTDGAAVVAQRALKKLK